MSYCRINETSDVYAYKAHNGERAIWMTHTSLDESGHIHMDGRDTFMDISLRGFRDRLLSLKKEGKRIPVSALERVEREAAMTRDALGDE